MRELIIIRPKRMEASAVKMQIFLDGQKVGFLSNGNSIRLNIDENAHEISGRGGLFSAKSFAFQMMIPAGVYTYCFQVDMVGYSDITPVLRPTNGMLLKNDTSARTMFGAIITQALLNPGVRANLNPGTEIQVSLSEEKWQLIAFENDRSFVLCEKNHSSSEAFGFVMTVLASAMDKANFDTPEHRNETIYNLYDNYLKFLPDFEIVELNKLRFRG